MNILFMSLIDFETIEEHNIYTDLLRVFKKKGHKLYIISPCERRTGKKTKLIDDNDVLILKLKIGNTQKTNVVEKAISTVFIEHQMKWAIKKYFSNIKFDLILYPTPPITLYKAVKYAKKRDNARTYLMLKDIFPQNAVDIGMMSDSGIKGLVYKYFRNKEVKLYKVSDKIGCMSQANVDYVLSHNKFIKKNQVEVCPNSIEVMEASVNTDAREKARISYGIPLDKTVFIYGGNLGKPQGIEFMIECLRKAVNLSEAFFLIVGDGTEYERIREFCDSEKPCNVKLIKRIPKSDYDVVVAASDIGLIFLDHRFTIPNFPSRSLDYMQARIPIFAVTDLNTDIGNIITYGNFGWWCESSDVDSFISAISFILKDNYVEKGINGYKYLVKEYDVQITYKTISEAVS